MNQLNNLFPPKSQSTSKNHQPTYGSFTNGTGEFSKNTQKISTKFAPEDQFNLIQGMGKLDLKYNQQSASTKSSYGFQRKFEEDDMFSNQYIECEEQFEKNFIDHQKLQGSKKINTFQKDQNLIDQKKISKKLRGKQPILMEMDNRIKQQKYKSSNSLYSDRFIPLRSNKGLNLMLSSVNKQSYYLDKENSRFSDGSDKEEQSMIFSELYKYHVLEKTPNFKQTLPQQLYPFQNNNFMKYKLQTNDSDKALQECINQRQYYKLEQSIDNYLSKVKKINKIPYKVLDAPALQDDFYLNLIDWSSQNMLAVGLSNCVYLWNADTSKVTKLCDLGMNDSVTSVGWCQKGIFLSIGTNSGEIQIWDTCTMKKVRSVYGHTARVGIVSWYENLLCSGSRDKSILQRDIRCSDNIVQKFLGHKQEVCGLKWSPNGQQLASGGNDNKLFIWNIHSQQPVVKFNQHVAAVKALAWSPHQHGLLVSGGGTQDRTIRFWNTLEQKQIKYLDTGSQVCNLLFSNHVNQIVSTHGYSQNQIIFWDYPQMDRLATLTGHTYRVLYLAMSPDGQKIVTGAGDETLRFWNVFENQGKQLQQENMLLKPESYSLR